MNKRIDEVIFVIFVDKSLGWNGRWEKKLQKKAYELFWFPVKNIKIPDIFYKILKFLGSSWASVIAQKDLLL